jgi:hypothetical protein
MRLYGRQAALVLSVIFGAGVVLGWLVRSDRQAEVPADIEVAELVGRCACCGLELYLVPGSAKGMGPGVYLCRTPHDRGELERLRVGTWAAWDGIVKVVRVAPWCSVDEMAWCQNGNAVRSGPLLLMGDATLLAEVCAALAGG